MKPSPWSIAAVVVALILFAGVMFPRGETSDDRIIYDAGQVLKVSKAHKAAQARLRAIAQAHADREAELARDYATRGRLLTKLDSALSKATNGRDSLPLLVRENVHLRGMLRVDSLRIRELNVAVLALVHHADSSGSRVATLEKNLAATLTVADCRINLVLAHPKCPSRGTLVVVTAATTLVLDRLVIKH